MTNAAWTGGRVDTTILGSETYIYSSAGWTVTIEYPVVPDPKYTITANYSANNLFVFWQGTDQSGTFTETNYAFSGLVSPTPSPTQLSTQEQVRDAIMLFIRTSHNETAPYMQMQAWTGGRATSADMLGSETYSYLSHGWDVTMRFPVTPNPIYNINATYVSPVSQYFPEKAIVSWQGTWQNGTIVETNYAYSP